MSIPNTTEENNIPETTLKAFAMMVETALDAYESATLEDSDEAMEAALAQGRAVLVMAANLRIQDETLKHRRNSYHFVLADTCNREGFSGVLCLLHAWNLYKMPSNDEIADAMLDQAEGASAWREAQESDVHREERAAYNATEGQFVYESGGVRHDENGGFIAPRGSR